MGGRKSSSRTTLVYLTHRSWNEAGVFRILPAAESALFGTQLTSHSLLLSFLLSPRHSHFEFAILHRFTGFNFGLACECAYMVWWLPRLKCLLDKSCHTPPTHSFICVVLWPACSNHQTVLPPPKLLPSHSRDRGECFSIHLFPFSFCFRIATTLPSRIVLSVRSSSIALRQLLRPRAEGEDAVRWGERSHGT
ncbi:hypothetical protein RSAG8_01406, partial [Rhizoctonia solani AG-8 WAC10335]